MRREIPLIICFVSGLTMMIQYYSPRIDQIGDTFLQWFNILTVFAFILGATSVLGLNGSRILRAQPGWGYNLVLLVSFFATLFVGLWKGTKQGTPFYWIFDYVYGPLQSTMYSLLAFFIASAAFRAFKAKTLEATLLLGTAFLVMLGRVPIGDSIWKALLLDRLIPINTLIDRWVMGTFNTAGQRAILLGASIGLISISLKIMLGIERSYLGGD